MNKHLSILIILLVTFFSCKKDNAVSTNFIMAGINNSPNNIFKSYDSTRLEFKYNTNSIFFINCDYDNTNEFEVINNCVSTRAGYSEFTLKIVPLRPSVEIACEEMIDSIISFSKKDTASILIKKYYEVDSVRTFFLQNFNRKVLYPLNFELETIITKSPKPLEYGQIVDSELNWVIDTLTLSISIFSQSQSVSGKYLNINTIDLKYGAWKNLKNRYIGLRINNRYGWLYLDVNSNGVLILTSLIEK